MKQAYMPNMQIFINSECSSASMNMTFMITFTLTPFMIRREQLGILEILTKLGTLNKMRFSHNKKERKNLQALCLINIMQIMIPQRLPAKSTNSILKEKISLCFQIDFIGIVELSLFMILLL